jgi:hypothetical protein
MKFIEVGRGTKDLTECHYGRLKVLGPIRRHTFPNGAKHIIWLCVCSCGGRSEAHGAALRDGRMKSCGCFRAEIIKNIGQRNFKHGLKNTPEWRIWTSVRGRCRSPSNPAYQRYGARGISICSRWDDFRLFLADVGPRPSPKHSLDRFPNQSGNYEPGNVRWATSSEQQQNKTNNVVVALGSRTGSLASFFEGGSQNPKYKRALQRLKRGWSASRAVA